jgi:transcriptional regulator of met regulon
MADKKKPTGYKTQIHTLHIVAVRKGQTEVNAPEHATWGTVKCNSYFHEFLIGPPALYGVFGAENAYVKKLEAILTREHKRRQQHQNNYDLGA